MAKLRASLHALFCLGLAAVGTAAVAAVPRLPIPVSPGSADGTMISATCPTFNWGEVGGANSYELVVYRVRVKESERALDQVLTVTVPGSAQGWTPPIEQCLKRGGSYAWSIRVVGNKESTEWSQPNLFQVAAGPTEEEFHHALAVVQGYLARFDRGARDSRSSADRAVVGKVRSKAGAPLAERPTDPSALTAGSGVSIADGGILINGRPVVTLEGRLVFITSTVNEGNLGGLVGADAICSSLASAAGLAGTYKAWLADDSCGPADGCRSFVQSTVPYVRVDGKRIADDWADLTDGTLQATISIDETGASQSSMAVWTNTLPSGFPESVDDCGDWSSGFGGESGGVGSSFFDNDFWTSGPFPSACDNPSALYCFEQ